MIFSLLEIFLMIQMKIFVLCNTSSYNLIENKASLESIFNKKSSKI